MDEPGLPGFSQRVVRRKVKRPRKGARGQRLVIRTVVATWAVQPPATDHLFDDHVRARLRGASDPSKASGWSPDVPVASS